MTRLHQAFQSLKYPRIHRNRKHKLLDIIILSIFAVLCGAEFYDSIDLPDIKDSIITIDAMGTQRAIAKKIIENGGDYMLAVKGHQGAFEEEVHAACKRDTPVSDTCTVEKGHGRIETRHCEVFEKGWIVDFDHRWESLKTVIKITSTRDFPSGKKETQERFYISSLKTDPDFNRLVRAHWG